jgi:hypothetical protein
MKNIDTNNQHLNSEQVVNLFKELRFEENNITSQASNHEDIDTESNLKSILSEGYKEGKIIVFRVAANDKNFLPKEKRNENNHFVALYFHNSKVYYIDPTGASIADSVKNIISNSNLVFQLAPINNLNAKLQYTNKQNIGKDNYIMGGNDYDCGVLLPLAVNLIKQDHKKRDQINLNEEDSRKVGELLREVLNGKTFDEVEEDIYQILESGYVKQEEDIKILKEEEVGGKINAELLKEVVLWNFNLSANFNSYKNNSEKQNINSEYNQGKDFSGKE